MANNPNNSTAKTKKPASADSGIINPVDSPITDADAKQIVKRKRNRPDLANFGAENCEPGDNARYLRYALVSWDLPPIDISDPVQVENRIREYFTHCAENDRKPNMIGMANWLGVDRKTILNWKNGDLRSETHLRLIKKAVTMLEELWVDYMQNGKVNPASGIFLGKNMFGYKDAQEVVVEPRQPLGESADLKQLEDKLSDIPLEDGDYTVSD